MIPVPVRREGPRRAAGSGLPATVNQFFRSATAKTGLSNQPLVAMLLPTLRSPEDAVVEARSDLIAWVWGGAVWSAVVFIADGEPALTALAAAGTFCLRRFLRLFVAF